MSRFIYDFNEDDSLEKEFVLYKKIQKILDPTKAIFVSIIVYKNSTMKDRCNILTSIEYIEKHDKNKLFYNNKSGVYYYIISNECITELLTYLYNTEVSPYGYQTFDLSYSAIDYTKLFSSTTVKNAYNKNYISKFLDYTFGIEFETNSGVIPENECYKNGLIPLRDGSITGYEYSTIVLGKTYGLEILKNDINVLNKYTSFDKDCSLHIHFGKLPITKEFIFILYKMCYGIESYLETILPRYTFHTDVFKTSHKNYCAKLYKFDTFEDMYSYYLDGNKLPKEIDLYAPHPNDIHRNRKWQIHTRYHWANFINLLFYDRAKTIEFRFLKPTYNYLKIVGWITIFTMIIKKAEDLYNEYLMRKETNSNFDFYAFISKCDSDHEFTISSALNNNNFGVLKTRNFVLKFLEFVGLETTKQAEFRDNIGLLTQFDEVYFNKHNFNEFEY